MVSERSFVVIILLSSLIVTLQADFAAANLCENKFSGIIPYPGRCDKYVLCVLWRPIEILCPEDEFFDKEVLKCVEGDRVLCQRTTTPNPITTTSVPPTLNEICTGVFFSPRPYPGDDHLFVGCIRGRGTVFQCEENELFIGNECVEVYTTTVSTTTPSTTTQSTTTTTMRTTTTTEVPILRNICDGIYNALVKHPSKDCSLYIQCYQQSETVYQCKIGEIFSLEQQKCAPGDDETCELFPENTVTATVPTQMPTTESSSFSESSSTTTEVITTEEPMTSSTLITTEEPTTEAPLTSSSFSESTSTTTEVITTEEPMTSSTLITTEEPTTEAPLTSSSFSESSTTTTEVVTTEEPMTSSSFSESTSTTTEVITTEEPMTSSTLITTEEPTTEVPLTSSSFSESSTTTTEVVTTEEPMTSSSFSESTSTTTEVITTEEPMTSSSFSESTSTTTEVITTEEPMTPELQTTTVETTISEEITSTLETSSEEVFQNPCDGIVYDLLPHPTKCFMFVQCVMSQFQMLTCAEHEIYDSVAQKCVPGDQETCTPI